VRAARLAESAAVAVVLVAFVVTVAPTLGQPLLDRHSFRQTQTAYTARIYHEQGIDLLHPKLPVLGEPFEVPFEFPLFQAGASVVMDAGVRDDVAMRVTGLFCFLLTALLLYGLVRKVDGRASALAALVAFVVTPFALVWGRASMIEYLATAGAVGFAWATISWRERRRPAVGGVALAAGLVGMLVKPTTAVFWVIPALAYRPSRVPPSERHRRDVALLVVILVLPLVAAALWTRHADAIKAASPTTAWLTGGELADWNFGSISQRFGRGFWGLMVHRLRDDVIGYAGIALLVVAVVALVRSSQRWFWLGIALAAALPPFVFTNLYLQHDYYLAAVTPAIAALIGLGAGFVWRLLPRRPLIRGLAIAAGLLLAFSTLALDRGYWRPIYADDPDPGALSLAQEIAQHTEPKDRVSVAGLDWWPTFLYYANRWGLMVVSRNEDVSYDLIHRHDYRYFVVADASVDLTPLTRWRWVGALGPRTYGIADAATELPKAQFAATNERRAALSAARALRRGFRIRCGEPRRIPSGARGTLILTSNPAPAGRVSVTDELAPLPTRRAIFVGPQVARAGVLTLECSGQPTLDVDVLDAPLPDGS
jgi:Dolichyl-phosphate-mannose-protein mannosyltransferase